MIVVYLKKKEKSIIAQQPSENQIFLLNKKICISLCKGYDEICIIIESVKIWLKSFSL